MSLDQTQKDAWTPPILVLMEDLDSDMIELLIDFAYHTPLHERIGLHNIGKVLDLAEKLKIFPIRDHCLSTLKKNLDPESCINIYHLASSRGYEHLAGEAFRYLVRNFDEVWKNTTQFHALTPEELRTILEDDNLYAPSEVEDTFGAILKWISANVDERKAYLAKFLPLVRFSRCSARDFDKVIGNPQVVDDGDSLKVLNVIRQTLHQQSMAVGVVAGVDLSPKLWLTPRVPKDILFLFGGWTVGATNNMLTYNCRAAKWRVMGNQYTSPSVGGFTGREVLDSVECYDPSTNVWTRVLTMSSPRSGVKVIAHKDTLYIMGGYNGIARLSSMEQLDVRKSRFLELPSMPHAKSNFAAVVLEGSIYTVGGFNGLTTVPLVERYDIATQHWYTAPEIAMNCSASAACIVHDVANPALWI